MTELGYRPEAPQGVQSERLVFIDPADRRGREFDIPAQGVAGSTINGDSPEVNQAVADAYAAVHSERQEAAAATPEANLTDEALREQMAAQTVWLVRVGRTGELEPDLLDPSLN